MENVSRLSERKIDVRRHQALLVEAETHYMQSIGKCFKASAAFCDFFGDMKMSIVNPDVHFVLTRISEIAQQTTAIPKAIAECHVAVQSIIEKSPYAGEVVMTGGLPKEPLRPPVHNG